MRAPVTASKRFIVSSIIGAAPETQAFIERKSTLPACTRL
jgi:hypothetical protein